MGFLFHTHGMDIEGLAFIRKNEAVVRALEEAHTCRLLKRAQASSHGRLGLLQAPGGRAQRAFPGNREKDRKIAPFEIVQRTPHTNLHALRAILMIVMQLC
ncbi:hypothetical protein D9M70_386470 [compost metagenome]